MTAAAGCAPVDERAFAVAMSALGPFEKNPAVAVAVSGGRDSVALALLARRWAARQGGTLTALTVDHGLRPASVREARQVGRWMRDLGLRHHTLRLAAQEAWRSEPGGLQAAARTARYDALAGWCRARGVLHLLLGHHRDDQAETFLERLARGSGLTGLAGMPPLAERGGVRLLRPLLGMARERLTATLVGAGQSWVEDESNADPRFLRTRLRQSRAVLQAEGLDSRRLADTMRRLGRARQAIDDAVARLLARTVAIYPHGYAVARAGMLAGGGGEVRLRALARLLQAIGGGTYPPREERLEALDAAVTEFAAGSGLRGRTLGGCRVIGRRVDGSVLICREPRAMASPLPLGDATEYVWDGRFAVRLPAREKGLEIGAVETVPDRRLRVILARLPAAVRPTVPAMIRNGAAVALPTMGWTAEDAAGMEGVAVTFVAAPPLAGGCFTVA
ncbi:MAG: tRNA lysidine(34) synthetase TilS [Acetobacterales bacterium]